MSKPVRVIEHLFVQQIGDTRENRKRAEAVLTERGCTVFRHTTGFSIENDSKLLRSEGFVVEEVAA